MLCGRFREPPPWAFPFRTPCVAHKRGWKQLLWCAARASPCIRPFLLLTWRSRKDIPEHPPPPVAQSPAHLVTKSRQAVANQPVLCRTVSQLPYPHSSAPAPGSPMDPHQPTNPYMPSSEGREAHCFCWRQACGYFINLFCLLLQVSLNHDRAHYHRKVSDMIPAVSLFCP